MVRWVLGSSIRIMVKTFGEKNINVMMPCWTTYIGHRPSPKSHIVGRSVEFPRNGRGKRRFGLRCVLCALKFGNETVPFAIALMA